MSTRERVAVRVKRAIRHLAPQHVAKARVTKRVIDRFADKIGLVYFGYVDQREEDQRLVRGHTVSATHIDSHYCIGTVHGYDVILLLRNDVVRLRNHKQARCHWLMYTIDLHTKVDVPAFYVGHKTREQIYEAKYSSHKPLILGHLAPYPSQFTGHYTVYGNAARTIEIERLITPSVADVIATHFQGASFEVEDNTLYMYIESKYPREPLLEKTLSNGLWLAEQIDTAMNPVVPIEDTGYHT